MVALVGLLDKYVLETQITVRKQNNMPWSDGLKAFDGRLGWLGRKYLKDPTFQN